MGESITIPVALIVEVTYDTSTERGQEISLMGGVDREDTLRAELESVLGQCMDLLSLPNNGQRWRSFSLPGHEGPAWEVPELLGEEGPCQR